MKLPAFLVGLLCVLLCSRASATYVHFESAPVHPVEISPDGKRLFVVHTADHRLVVFDLERPGAPRRIAEVPVGLEPVTVRARTDDEVWVVNHVSDTISIVDVRRENVVRTISTGDEPTDVVFVGTPERAFVCVSQEDLVRVYDPGRLDDPPVEIPLEGSDPRSLAVSPDESRVYVAVHDSQNRTTVVGFPDVSERGGLPAPVIPMDPDLPEAPVTGLIVRDDGSGWRDETGETWDDVLGYRLLDHDVIAIGVVDLGVVAMYSNVGTTLFGLAVNPRSGELLVTNQEARNDVRFEPVLKGRFVESRVTHVDPRSGLVTPANLNRHIDHELPAGSATERALSLSIPNGIVFSGDGRRAYATAFGSAKVAVLDERGEVLRRIPVGHGPGGIALDEARGRLYVANRHASTLSVVNLADDSSYELVLGFDPTPANVVEGRILFYSGERSSAHGDLSCASCHLFGGMDNIAWDLGDPRGEFVEPPQASPGDSLRGFHPMKGPMVTQTLKALSGTQPFHWRGDRPELVDFNPAFVGLLGRRDELAASDFALFEDFVFSLGLAPNPHLRLDGSLPRSLAGGDPRRGEGFYARSIADGGGACVECHGASERAGARIVPAGRIQAISTQEMTIPQLRTMYEKTRFDPEGGRSVRGFGSSHSGFRPRIFPHQLTLGEDGGGHGRAPEPDTRDIEAYLLAFDTGTHPVVGAQRTFAGASRADHVESVRTMMSAAERGEAGVIAKGRDRAREARGWAYVGGGRWLSDRSAESPWALEDLLALAGEGTEITITGVLPGTETRLGIDRDRDGWRDRDERDAGSDPGDPRSVPPVALGSRHPGPELELLGRNPARDLTRFVFALPAEGAVRLAVYDVHGRLVRTLVDSARHRVGFHEGEWDLTNSRGRRVSSGVYWLRVTDRRGSAARRLAVVR